MIAVKPGQQLSINWRGWRETDLVKKRMNDLKLCPLTNGGEELRVYVTCVDQNGVSIHIVRGGSLGPDIVAFVPLDVQFGSYFLILNAFNPLYADTSHAMKRFPLDFV